MSDWLEGLSTLQVLLFVLAVTFGISVVAAIIGAILVRRGMHRPATVARASRLAERALRLIKRPLTLVVLDEVEAVIQTGHYTRSISEALLENHDELKALVAEKVRQDPNVRLIGRLPGYDTIVSEVTETTLRILIEMLDDPRTDELISDLVRNTLTQVKESVRLRAHETVGPHDPPDPIPPRLAR